MSINIATQRRWLLLRALSIAAILTLASLGTLRAQTRPAILGISHMTLYADNLPQSEKYYANTLGWKQMPIPGAATGVRFYANHAQYIQLVSPPRPGMVDRLVSFGFMTADAGRMRLYLAAHGVQVPSAITQEANGDRTFAVHDPEGNAVEFTQLAAHPVPPPHDPGQRLSTHILHAGFAVRNPEALNRFYRDLLGFHLYWQGEPKPGPPDWISMQVPDGTDWIEYMLKLPPTASREQLGMANHFAPGVANVHAVQQRLIAEKRDPAPQKHKPQLGVDGKWQLNLFDPDGTRVEFMEFKPVQAPCCAPFTGRQPVAQPGW